MPLVDGAPKGPVWPNETDLVEAEANLQLVTGQPGFAVLPQAIQEAVIRERNRLSRWPDIDGRCTGEIPGFNRGAPIDWSHKQTREGVEMILRRVPDHPLLERQDLFCSPEGQRDMDDLRKKYRFDYRGEYGRGCFEIPYWAVYDERKQRICLADIRKGTVEIIFPDGRSGGVFASDLGGPRGFIFVGEEDLLVCSHARGQIIHVQGNGKKSLYIDLKAHADRVGPYLHPMLIQRTGETDYLLLSTADLKQRQLFAVKRGRISKLPVSGLTVNCLRARDRTLYLNDIRTGRLLGWNQRTGTCVPLALEPFPGCYYFFCFTPKAIFHIFNGQSLSIVKTGILGQTIFRRSGHITTGAPIPHILCLEAFQADGRMRLILSDAGRKSIHLIDV